MKPPRRYVEKPADLAKWRTRLGLSQEAFGRLLGVTANSISRWERGTLGMKASTAKLIEICIHERLRAATREATPRKRR